MKNMSFVIWLLFYPLMESIDTWVQIKCDHENKRVPKVYSDSNYTIIAILKLCIWFAVGCWLYVPN
jgi:hypothetical protein